MLFYLEHRVFAFFSALAIFALLAIPQTEFIGDVAVRGATSTKDATESPFNQRDASFALRDGDRVLFYGDSITEQRLYTTYVEHYVLTHYANRRVTFINTGWGGDKVTGNDCRECAGVGGLARLKRDLIDRRPTVVTLLFGMNDGEYKEFDPATLRTYTNGLTAIIRQIKAQLRGARIYLMTPTVYDGTRHTPWSHTDRYNEVLDRYSEAAKQIAEQEKLPVIDLHRVTTEALRHAKEIDSNYTFLPDGVHPVEDGQLVMAAEILRSWGAPAKGFEIERQVKPDAAGQVRLSVVAPLPWPATLPTETLRRVRPEIMELGQVRLKLNGLAAGKYRIKIDGAEATYTAEQLRDGINLNEATSAASEASRALGALVRQRADLFFTLWRQIEVPFGSKFRSTSAAVSSLDALINELGEQERTLAQPHQYEIEVLRAS